MPCSIPYLDNAPISQTEKDRLSDIHVDIFRQAKDSKVFREIDNRLQTVKKSYAEATAFIGKINSQYGKVSRLASIGNGNSVLTVDVLPLNKEEQGVIPFEEEVENAPEEGDVISINGHRYGVQYSQKRGVDFLKGENLLAVYEDGPDQAQLNEEVLNKITVYNLDPLDSGDEPIFNVPL